MTFHRADLAAPLASPALALALSFGLLFAATALSCRSSKNEAHAARAAHPAASGGPLERYFPLADGHLYNYVTTDGADTGMLVATVHRVDAAHGELRLSNATRRFVLTTDGVAYESGAFILKMPLTVGTSWVGEHGGTTRITEVNASKHVQAGSYDACVETVEEGGRPAGSTYSSSYCEGVGMVLLRVQAGGREAKAELKSYGLPVRID